MARQKTGTAKRPTAAQKESQKRRRDLSKKLSDEIQAHNALARQIEGAKEELAQRRGRIGFINEELAELGGPVESVMAGDVVEPPQPQDN